MLRSPAKKTLFGWPLLFPDFMQSDSAPKLLVRLNLSIRVAGLLRNVLAGMASEWAFRSLQDVAARSRCNAPRLRGLPQPQSRKNIAFGG